MSQFDMALKWIAESTMNFSTVTSYCIYVHFHQCKLTNLDSIFVEMNIKDIYWISSVDKENFCANFVRHEKQIKKLISIMKEGDLKKAL